MPVTRKQQILAKVETSEGVSSAPGASDAILVFDPSLSDSVETIDRVPAGASLSRDFVPIGRKTRQIQFKSDFRGSGDTSIPITLPDWANLLFACGFATGSMKATVLGVVTGVGFMVGEIVTQSAGAIRGIVVGIISVAGAPVHRTTETGAVLAIAEITGTITAAATTGSLSLSTSTAAVAVAYPGVVMQPTSTKSVTVTVPSWSAGVPAVGEHLAVESPAGITVGAAQILADNGSMLSMELGLLYGSMLATYTLRNASGTSIATISAATQNKTPSLSIRHNLDGRRRELLGARGDFSLEAEVGQPMQFSWDFSGDIGTAVDTPAVATTGLSSIRPPRFIGAVAVFGWGSLQSRLPTKRVALALGGSVNPNLDANRDGGATGSNVTDRDPTITFTVDAVHAAFDWESLRDNSTTVRCGFVLGTTPGNIVAVVAPVCQVTEVQLSDSDGIATLDVTLRPRRVNESGDDELFFVQL